MFGFNQIKCGKTIKIGKIKYRLLEEVEGTFISYIPDCDNEEDGIDEYGNYYDDLKCKVYAYVIWRAAQLPNYHYVELKLHLKLPKWGTLIKPNNKALYNKISINEKAHKKWAEIIE